MSGARIDYVPLPTTLFPWQTDAVEYFRAIFEGAIRRCMICTLPGTGKSVLAAVILLYFKFPRRVHVVITPVILHDQWSEKLTWFGVQHRIVHTADEYNSVSAGHVAIMCPATARALPVNILPVGIVVCDERENVGDQSTLAIERMNMHSLLLISTAAPNKAFLALLSQGRMHTVKAIQTLVHMPDASSVLPPHRDVNHFVPLHLDEFAMYREVLGCVMKMKNGYASLVHLLRVLLGQIMSKVRAVQDVLARIPHNESVLVFGADEVGLQRIATPSSLTQINGVCRLTNKFVITKQTLPARRAEIFREAKQSPGCVVFCDTGAVSFGLDLQFFRHMLMVSPVHDEHLRQTLMNRVVRATGQESTIHWFYAKDTIEMETQTPRFLDVVPMYLETLVKTEVRRLNVPMRVQEYDNVLDEIRSKYILVPEKKKRQRVKVLPSDRTLRVRK